MLKDIKSSFLCLGAKPCIIFSYSSIRRIIVGFVDLFLNFNNPLFPADRHYLQGDQLQAEPTYRASSRHRRFAPTRKKILQEVFFGR